MNMSFYLAIAKMLLIPLLVVLTPIIIGQRYGIWRSKKSENLQNASVGSVVAAAFGLLAFMLAFTFQMAAGRYEARKELLLEEVTNIRTTWLRAGVIPEPFRTDTRKLLVEYVDLRVDVDRHPANLSSAMSGSQQILDRLWESVEILAERDRSSEMYSLFTSSVNDLVDNYNQRITMTLEYRIPTAILGILFIITFLSMLALGYQFGISGKGSFRINLLLAIVFALVMFLILALDRPETGLAKLNQKPMLTLQQQLNGNLFMQKNK
jgi:ABC-type multidrug transport system fused ATPase/permease subunit